MRRRQATFDPHQQSIADLYLLPVVACDIQWNIELLFCLLFVLQSENKVNWEKSSERRGKLGDTGGKSGKTGGKSVKIGKFGVKKLGSNKIWVQITLAHVPWSPNFRTNFFNCDFSASVHASLFMSGWTTFLHFNLHSVGVLFSCITTFDIPSQLYLTPRFP